MTEEPDPEGPRSPEDEMRRLVKVLGRAQPGSLIFVQLDAPSARRRVPARLVAEGLARPIAYLHFFDRPPADREAHPVAVIEEFVAAQNPAPEVLFVDGVESRADFSTTHRPGDVVEALTVGREALASLPVVLVFLMPGYAIDQIRNHSVSLWSWRAYLFHLDGLFGAEPGSSALAFLRVVSSQENAAALASTIATLYRIHEENRKRGIPISQDVISVIAPLADSLAKSGDAAASLALVEGAVAKLSVEPLPHVQAQALLDLRRGTALLLLGRFAEADQYFSSGLEARSQSFGESSVEITPYLEGRVRALIGLGRVEAAVPLLERMLSIVRAAGYVTAEVMVLIETAEVAWQMRNLEAAETTYVQALAAAERVGDRHLSAVVLGSLGILLAELGQFDRASSMLEREERIAYELGEPPPLRPIARLRVARLLEARTPTVEELAPKPK